MERGRVAQFDTPRAIYQRPVSHYVASFTGEASELTVQIVSIAGQGYYRVSIDGTEITVSGPPGLRPGAARSLMLRPEAMTIAASGVPASVNGFAFLGAVQQCDMRVGPANVNVLAGPNHRMAVGDRVHLHIDPDLAWLLPESGA
jgi:ABC-type Fe3+/spermidine/putrescine transport system ATPase subunit